MVVPDMNINHITIGGWSCTGTSSVGKLLAEYLHFPFHSSGNKMRAMAHDRGYGDDVKGFLKEMREKGEKVDDIIDTWIKQFKECPHYFVLDSRLAWWFLPDTFKIALYCDPLVRAQRCQALKKMKSVEEALEHLQERDAKDYAQYVKLYPTINPLALRQPEKSDVFHLKIDTSGKTARETSELILSHIPDFIKTRPKQLA